MRPRGPEPLKFWSCGVRLVPAQARTSDILTVRGVGVTCACAVWDGLALELGVACADGTFCGVADLGLAWAAVVAAA